MSRLTSSQIEEIVTLHNKGLSQRAIARLKGYSRGTVKKYVKLYNIVTTTTYNVYSINMFLVWLFVITVIGLALFGIYTLINF